MNNPVNNIEEFKKKYGEKGDTFSLLIEEYVRRAPIFNGDVELAGEIGIALSDLEHALKGSKND